MKATGYWEWESSTTRGARLTPASVGFSRQLVFKSDGKVHIYHNRQPELQAVYRLSQEVDACQPPQPQPVAVPMVRYTAEAQFPNSDLRRYGIALAAADTTLYVDGVGLCTDTGAAERYRWRSK
ncbi:hypothetical protein BEN48_13945 [Hymenobacter glacialis]|uniref:Uncharacterized protein n=2 Tax=Hymenobacter glacialis TaxID=1908236 RepID=A0A1G1T4V7_9BACT|nr:hypothetical protein BEN48_13945 [Hymenobacter glacialis]